MAVEQASIPLSERVRCNKAELAEVFGVSVAAVDAWLRRGCPYVQRGGRGQSWVFHMLDVAQWRWGQDESQEDDPEKLAPKERLDWYRGETERLKLDELQGRLIDAGRAVEIWRQHIETAKGRLMSVPGAMSAEVFRAESVADVEHMLRDALYAVMEEIANAGADGG